MMTKERTVMAHTVTRANKKRRMMYDATDAYLCWVVWSIPTGGMLHTLATTGVVALTGSMT
jgi:hypothetical protein